MKPGKSKTNAAPRIGLVSLGCPKALVDSERIVTRLRAEGYALSPDYAGADAVVVNTCGFLNSAKEESLQAIGEALAENGRVIVTGCLGVEADRIRAQYPDVLAITGPHQYEAVVEAVHAAVPRLHDPYRRPRAAARHPPHAAPLRLSEDLRRLQPRVPLLHHPELARTSPEPDAQRRDARGRAPRRRRRAGAPRHLPGHERLRARPRLRQERLAGRDL